MVQQIEIILKANDGDFWYFWRDLKAQFPDV